MGFLDTLLRTVASRPEARDLDEAGRLRLEVVRLYEGGAFGEAEVVARRLVELLAASVGEHHPDYASALSNLALLLQSQGDLDAAGPLLRQVAEVRKEALGDGHPDYAASLNNLALLLCERHHLDAAEPLLRQALEVRKKALGEDHPDYANSLSSLAFCLCEKHDLYAAEPLLRQALEIRERSLGSRHPEYATSLNNLALLLSERHDLDAAEPLLRQALEIRAEVLGENHPDTRSSADALATVLVKKGAPAGAGSPSVADLLKASPAWDHGPDLDPRAGDEAAGGPRQGPEPRGGAAILSEALKELTRAFAVASEALLQEASRMDSPGHPPDLLALSQASACHRRFVDLRVEVLRLAEQLALRPPPAERIATLADLSGLLRDITAAEEERAKQDGARLRALEIVEQVLRLRARDDAGRRLLDDCQEQARNLDAALRSCLVSELPPDAERLLGGAHPLASLLSLVRDGSVLSEDAWSERYREVSLALGTPLAVASARGRIVLGDDVSPGPVADDRGPADAPVPVAADGPR